MMEIVRRRGKLWTLWLGLMLLSLLLGACGSSTDPSQGANPPPSSPPGSGDPPPLTVQALRAQPVWHLLDSGPVNDPVPVLPGSSITLSFGLDGQLGGSGGCNQYGGNFVIQGQTLTVGSIASTLRACLDDGFNEQETTYFQLLEGSHQVTLSEDRLTLSSEGGRLRFGPQSETADPPLEEDL